jgi:hypothetical protein
VIVNGANAQFTEPHPTAQAAHTGLRETSKGLLAPSSCQGGALRLATVTLVEATLAPGQTEEAYFLATSLNRRRVSDDHHSGPAPTTWW